MSNDSAACVVLCTCPDADSARHLANGLVSQRLAACVNRIGPIQSVYEWQGEVCSDEEYQLIIKTRPATLAALERWLKAEHPYDVPEIIALETSRVEREYRQWMNQVLELPPLEDAL